VAGVAAALVVVLFVTGGSDDDPVPEVVRALAPSTVLVEVERGGSRSATGSGWVLDADEGLVATNAHVVNDGDGYAVVASGRRRPAELAASSPCEDLALLRLADSAGLESAPLGSGVEQGATVVALGFPQDAGLGATLSATRGVVSAARTSFRDPAADVPAYPEVIQTDTALNPGNSGGPLANLDARVVGVNAAARTAGSDGRPLQSQNYAIPIERARGVLADMRLQGSSGWLGVSFGYPDVADLAEQGLPPGLYLTGAVPGTPAAKAGLGHNELLVAVDGQPIQSTLQSWCEVAGEIRSNQEVALTVLDPDGKERAVRLRMP
jgi:putative serine protease PepD